MKQIPFRNNAELERLYKIRDETCANINLPQDILMGMLTTAFPFGLGIAINSAISLGTNAADINACKDISKKIRMEIMKAQVNYLHDSALNKVKASQLIKSGKYNHNFLGSKHRTDIRQTGQK